MPMLILLEILNSYKFTKITGQINSWHVEVIHKYTWIPVFVLHQALGKSASSIIRNAFTRPEI